MYKQNFLYMYIDYTLAHGNEAICAHACSNYLATNTLVRKFGHTDPTILAICRIHSVLTISYVIFNAVAGFI